MVLVGQVYWVGIGESGLLGGSASVSLLGGGRFADCNLLVGVCWGGGGGCQGLLGYLAGFDLLDGVYLLRIAGSGLLGLVC